MAHKDGWNNAIAHAVFFDMTFTFLFSDPVKIKILVDLIMFWAIQKCTTSVSSGLLWGKHLLQLFWWNPVEL